MPSWRSRHCAGLECVTTPNSSLVFISLLCLGGVVGEHDGEARQQLLRVDAAEPEYVRLGARIERQWQEFIKCDEQLDLSCLREQQPDEEEFTVNYIDPAGLSFHSESDAADDEHSTPLRIPNYDITDTGKGAASGGQGGAEQFSNDQLWGTEVQKQQSSDGHLELLSTQYDSTSSPSDEPALLRGSEGEDVLRWPFTPPSKKDDPPKPPFHLNMTEAGLIADLQSAVYCTHEDLVDWNCTRCRGTLESFAIHRSILLYDWDLTAFVGYWPLFDAVFAVFRGSDSKSISNWVSNLDAHRRLYTLPGVAPEDMPHTRGSPYVHAGFYRSLFTSSLYLQVRAALRVDLLRYGNKPLYLVGHSLGASMAALAAPRLKHELKPPVINLFTFGCPRTGNIGYSDLLMASVNNSVRFTHGSDIVPSVPLPDLGFFHHFPTEVWQTDPPASYMHAPGACSCEQRLQDRSVANSTFHVCDESGEDRTCHDSMCYYRPCSSTADHLHYLGRPMYHSTEEC